MPSNITINSTGKINLSNENVIHDGGDTQDSIHSANLPNNGLAELSGHTIRVGDKPQAVLAPTLAKNDLILSRSRPNMAIGEGHLAHKALDAKASQNAQPGRWQILGGLGRIAAGGASLAFNAAACVVKLASGWIGNQANLEDVGQARIIRNVERANMLNREIMIDMLRLDDTLVAHGLLAEPLIKRDTNELKSSHATTSDELDYYWKTLGSSVNEVYSQLKNIALIGATTAIAMPVAATAATFATGPLAAVTAPAASIGVGLVGARAAYNNVSGAIESIGEQTKLKLIHSVLERIEIKFTELNNLYKEENERNQAGIRLANTSLTRMENIASLQIVREALTIAIDSNHNKFAISNQSQGIKHSLFNWIDNAKNAFTNFFKHTGQALKWIPELFSRPIRLSGQAAIFEKQQQLNHVSRHNYLASHPKTESIIHNSNNVNLLAQYAAASGCRLTATELRNMIVIGEHIVSALRNSSDDTSGEISISVKTDDNREFEITSSLSNAQAISWFLIAENIEKNGLPNKLDSMQQFDDENGKIYAFLTSSPSAHAQNTPIDNLSNTNKITKTSIGMNDNSLKLPNAAQTVLIDRQMDGNHSKVVLSFSPVRFGAKLKNFWQDPKLLKARQEALVRNSTRDEHAKALNSAIQNLSRQTLENLHAELIMVDSAISEQLQALRADQGRFQNLEKWAVGAQRM